MLWYMSSPFQARKFVHRKLWKNSAKRLTHIGVQSQTSVPDPLLWNFDVHFAQKRTFPPGPRASSGRCRPDRRGGSDDAPKPFEPRPQHYSGEPPVFGPDTESQSRLKVDQKKCAGRRKKRDWKTPETYFGWPVTGSTDMRVV